MASPFLLLRYFAVCLLNMAVVNSTSPFLTNTPGQAWRMVGSLNMTDPTQHCPDSWQNFTSPRSCGKKTTAPCDSLSIPTFGVSYQKVCGWFRGYQFGSPDAFGFRYLVGSVEGSYVDGVSITYGSPGRRQHVYTYASGAFEQLRDDTSVCPCQGGASAPSFVGSDYYCESGNPDTGWRSEWYSSDVLWDGLQCGGNESTCCNRTDLPWFCKTFSTPISEDLEVRICTDEGLDNENVAIESFELYIQGEIRSACSFRSQEKGRRGGGGGGGGGRMVYAHPATSLLRLSVCAFCYQLHPYIDGIKYIYTLRYTTK